MADSLVLPGRRALLGAMAALPVAAASAAAAELDPHLTWLEEYHALVARLEEEAWLGAHDDPGAWDEVSEIEDRILDTWPTTLGGVAAQLMVVVEAMHRGSCFGDQVTSPLLARAAELLPAPGFVDILAGSA